jgi:hypothetical protein
MKEICSICQRPILDGEGRYTAGEHKGIFRHWECYKKDAQKLQEALDRFEARTGTTSITHRKKQCRLGDGRTARRLAVKIAAAVKTQLGYDIDPTDLDFWVQPPAYRGSRWDLAVWGARVKHPDPQYTNLVLTFHSWDTMSRLVKQKTVKLMQDGSAFTFDVG